MNDNLEKNEDTKDRILEAAEEVFAQRGFRAATVREICNRAGAHVGAINYHFRNKEELYATTLMYSYRRSLKNYPPDFGLSKDAAPKDKLRAFIHSFLLRTLAESPFSLHAKLLIQEAANPSAALNKLVESSVRPLYKYLATIVRELMYGEKTLDREENREIFLVAMSIIGQCLQYHINRNFVAALRPQDFDPSQIEQIADHITRFSLGGIREMASSERNAGNPRKRSR